MLILFKGRLMSSSRLIALATMELKCTQTELAKKIGVSQAQISLWKSGEYMSLEMKEKLKELLDIRELEPDFVHWTGGLEQSRKWYALIGVLADNALDACETGYNTRLLQDEDPTRSILASGTIRILMDMGLSIPQIFPAEIDFKGVGNDQHSDSYLERLDENFICQIITGGYEALNNLFGFFTAYILPIIEADPDNDQKRCEIYELESELLELAFTKAGQEAESMPDYNIYSYKTEQYWAKSIEELKVYAVKNQISLKAELMDLISQDHESTGQSAERERYGFNISQVHPDIYMNEILLNLRLINQVLPVICKKLGIEAHEYDFDETEFSAR